MLQQPALGEASIVDSPLNSLVFRLVWHVEGSVHKRVCTYCSLVTHALTRDNIALALRT